MSIRNKWPIYMLAAIVLATGSSVLASHISLSRTELSGSQEVPAVTTDASGRARFKAEAASLEFDLRAQDAEAVTAAHLHCAPVGQNGPVIAFLFGNVPGGFNVDGQLAAFRLTDANILPAGTQCNPAVTNITDLTAAIAAGNIYVNVHTVAHPNGEIRGQLRP